MKSCIFMENTCEKVTASCTEMLPMTFFYILTHFSSQFTYNQLITLLVLLFSFRIFIIFFWGGGLLFYFTRDNQYNYRLIQIEELDKFIHFEVETEVTLVKLKFRQDNQYRALFYMIFTIHFPYVGRNNLITILDSQTQEKFCPQKFQPV